MKQILALALILGFSAFAFASGDESAPMVEKEFSYKDWTFKNLQDGKEINLRSFAAGKQLVLIVYFAAWCPNWRNEAPHVQKLYDKYKDKGFDVVAVSEYASLDETKKNIADNKFTFTVVTESESSDAKQKTTHYGYRQATGDTRNWGSPWNIFLEPGKLEAKGETISKKAFVVNGEIIETEVEAFIRQKLGLPAETKTTAQSLTKNTETCESTTALKKP